MNLKYLLLVLFLSCIQFVSAQEDTIHIGIHQLESRQFRSRGDSMLLQQKPFLSRPSALLTYKKLELSRKVFGWHPYWASASSYLSYDYNILTHLSYFSYETDTVTGGYKTINGWDQTPIIDYAHQRGVKVLLTVTNFGTAANHALLRDTLRQIKMIQTITSLLKTRNGDGVNFDLELVSLAHRSDLVAFMSRAAKTIRAEIPGAEISMATPAVDWNGSWDLPALAAICDYLIVMGYDYYWSGSTTAGPVSPMAGENYNVTKSVDTYLAAGVPSQKLMLGIPWFGYNWPVVSSVRKATATGKATSLTSVAADALALTYGKTFDQTTKVTWISFKDGSNLYRQVWYDDGTSYPIKFDLVNNRSLAGIGIWALSYENGKQDLWQGIQSAFSATAINDPIVIQKSGNDLVLFPNPVNGMATIRFKLAERQNVDLSVVDLSGKLVVSILRKELPADNYTILFDCFHLKNQVYILVSKSTKGNLTRKFVVKNN
ncbi:MAG: glycosyl hydrolase family 18 protein [Prolixibacteraceae bacterium]|nr:glycosyl hydrolase family 18 protein [Prolixibacteraceae bacterium]